MKFLLDTQCWLWWIAQPEKLNEAAIRHITDKSNHVLFSAASSWEIAIKYGLGKLKLSEPPLQFIPKRLARDRITAISIEHIHALHVSTLPHHHRDPFDRLLIAQAQIEGIPILTADEKIDAYDVEVIQAH